jgi:hypothetical protein
MMRTEGRRQWFGIVLNWEVVPTDITAGGGCSATIGIENGTGTKACQWAYHGAPAVTNGSALLLATQPVVTRTGRSAR